MAYTGEQLPPEISGQTTEPEKPTGDGPSIGTRIAARTMAGVLSLGALPHAVACAKPDAVGSLFCESKVPMRHDWHIDQSSAVSSSAGVQTALQAAILNIGSSQGVVIRPPTAEVRVTAYAPTILTVPTDPTSGA